MSSLSVLLLLLPKTDPRRRSSQSQPPSGSGRGSSNIIEFVDSQDPNVKSAIQRHTAYHSAAQRRDARLRSLRRSSQSRFLEWGRRPTEGELSTTAATAATAALSRESSSTSVSISPVRSLASPDQLPSSEAARPGASREHGSILTATVRPQVSTAESGTLTLPASYPTSSATSRESIASAVQLTQTEEAVLDFYLSNICDATHVRELYEAVLSYVRTDDACIYLMMAYAFARRSHESTGQDSDTDRRTAQYNFGRGTNILWNRLRDTRSATSDVNVQAVLLLIAYSADFGETDEMQIHKNALQTMVEERGGISGFESNATLYQQLLSLETSRKFHLTLDCTSMCSQPFRFPQSAWSQRLRSRD